jgi:uncharacterized protein with von Willebrand factor type A (vWA) domain
VPDVGPRLAAAFAAVVRGLGVDVPVGSTILLGRALAEVGLDDRAAVYWAGRATLVRRPEDIAAYDRAFEAFWSGAVGSMAAGPEPTAVPLALDDATGDPEDDDGVTAPAAVVRYSRAEVLRQRDFAAYSPEEHDEARRLLADVRVAGAHRRSRRMQRVRSRRGRPDVGRTVRAGMRRGGEITGLERRAPGARPRRVVLLLDVSGSMEPYARALARFLHVAVAGRRRVEAFAVGTRLHRITRELSTRDPDAALAAAAARVTDWSGGTRLGEGLRRFNDEWGMRGAARGAVVVIMSDGWDRGDPALLEEQMVRLRRVAHRVIWVNPLKASEGYAPLARGMAAALPYVDDFVEGHSLASVEALVGLIAGASA